MNATHALPEIDIEEISSTILLYNQRTLSSCVESRTSHRLSLFVAARLICFNDYKSVSFLLLVILIFDDVDDALIKV